MSDASPGLPTGPLDLLAKAALAPQEIAKRAWLEWRRSFSIDETPWNEVRMLASIAPRLKWLESDVSVAPRIQGIRKFLYAHTQVCLMGAMEGMKALNTVGISILLMKGAARIACDPAAAQERLIRDVDLLVPFDDKSRAFDVIHSLGWGFKPAAQWQDFWRGVDEASHHAWALAKGNAEIDLHHHSNVLNRLIGDDAGLWARASAVNWRGIRLFVPAATDNLLMSIVHGLRWSRDHAADWTIDASASIDGGAIDWSVFVSEVNLRKLQAVTVLGLQYLHATLKKPVPPDAVAELQRGITPMQVAELERYSSAPTSRDFPEAACAYAMSLERLSARRNDCGAKNRHQATLQIELTFEQNSPNTISIADIRDDIKNLEVIVRLQTNLPRGTKLLGSVGILGVLMDKGVAETGSTGQAEGVCELSFSIFVPLLRRRGANNLLFVAGVLGEATPLYWRRTFTA